MIDINAILQEAARARESGGSAVRNAEERKQNRSLISQFLAQSIFPLLATIEAEVVRHHGLRLLRHQLNDGTWTGFTLEFPSSPGAPRFEVTSNDESPARIVVKDAHTPRGAPGIELCVEFFAFAEYERLLENFLRRAVGLEAESPRSPRKPILGPIPPMWQSAAA